MAVFGVPRVESALDTQLREVLSEAIGQIARCPATSKFVLYMQAGFSNVPHPANVSRQTEVDSSLDLPSETVDAWGPAGCAGAPR